MVWLGVIQPYCWWNMPNSRKVRLYLTSYAILFWLRTGFPQKGGSSSHNPAESTLPPHISPKQTLKNNMVRFFFTCQNTGTFPNTTKKKTKRKNMKKQCQICSWGLLVGTLPSTCPLRCKDWDLSLFLLAQVHVREAQGDGKRNPTTQRFFGP